MGLFFNQQQTLFGENSNRAVYTHYFTPAVVNAHTISFFVVDSTNDGSLGRCEDYNEATSLFCLFGFKHQIKTRGSKHKIYLTYQSCFCVTNV